MKVRVLRRAGLRVVASALLAPWMAHRNGLWIFGRGFGWWAGVMLIAVSAPALSEGESKAASRDVPSVRQPAAASSAATSGAPLQLKVRRLSEVLEVVVHMVEKVLEKFTITLVVEEVLDIQTEKQQ